MVEDQNELQMSIKSASDKITIAMSQNFCLLYRRELLKLFY